MTLDVLEGRLDAAARFRPGTIQHADELSRDQVADPWLGKRGYFLGDLALYYVNSGHPMVALARSAPERPNLIFAHIQDSPSSYNLLRGNDSFRPDPSEARKAIQAEDTLHIPLHDLRLHLNHDRRHASLYIEINGGVRLPMNHADREMARSHGGIIPPTPIEQQLFDRVGYTPAFLRVLRHAIGGSSVWTTSVGLLNPDFVLREAADGPISRAVARGDFSKTFSHTNLAVGYGVDITRSI